MAYKFGRIAKCKTYGIRELTEAVQSILTNDKSIAVKNGDTGLNLVKKYGDDDEWNFYSLTGRESGKEYALLSKQVKDHKVRYRVVTVSNGFTAGKYRR